ncbi:MAG: hypothetical protein Q7R83_04245 [bacterium]|nr:hypothetical protein [bacterium]
MRWFLFCFVLASFLFLSPAYASTIDWRQVNDAKAEVQSAPLNADAWLNLALAYHQMIELHRDESLPTIIQAWRSAEHRSLQLRYGSLTAPKTLQEGLELAQIFTNNWQVPCHGVSQCFNETELDLLRALGTSVASRVWDLSSPAESKAATEWDRRTQDWNHDWVDAGFELKAISILATPIGTAPSSPDPETGSTASFFSAKKIFWTSFVAAFVLIAGVLLLRPRGRRR